MHHRINQLVLSSSLSLVTLAACSGSDTGSPPGGTGGTLTAQGGAVGASGGSTAAGTSSSSGGSVINPGTGGVSATGGSSVTTTSISSGGTMSAGGTSTAGGTTSTGGTKTTGGAASTWRNEGDRRRAGNWWEHLDGLQYTARAEPFSRMGRAIRKRHDYNDRWRHHDPGDGHHARCATDCG